MVREGRLSKLVSRMALSHTVIRVLEKSMLERFARVTTTAFSKHPVSMKYRGIFEKTSARLSDTQPGINILQYQGKVTDEDPQQVYEWWWRRFGKSAVASARNGDAPRRSENAEAA
jgi:hypothetical protein